MVLTRAQERLGHSEYALIDELLAGNTRSAQLLLERSQDIALVARTVGPSNFGALHAAALTDSHRCAAAAALPPPARPCYIDRCSTVLRTAGSIA